MTLLTADTEIEQVNALRQLFIRARDSKRSRYDTWIRNYRLLNNRYGSTVTQQWMPAPRDSEIYPICSSLVGWMTDQNIMVDVYPAADPHSTYYDFMSKLANDLEAVLLSSWTVEDYESQVKLGLWDAAQYGVGIYKSVWDGARSAGYGNAVIRRVDPWSFYPDPHASSLEDAEYLVEARRMSFDEIERRFPDASVLLEAQGSAADQVDERPSLFQEQTRVPMANPGQIPGSGSYSSPGSSVIGRFAAPTSIGRRWNPLPSYVVYEFWIRENSSYYDDEPGSEDHPQLSERHVEDRWRVVVMANSVILMDEYADELWSHAQHPYERFVFDDTGEFYGIALIDHLAYPQIYINRLLTAAQQNTELTGNPIFLEPTNAGTQRIGIVNRPGLRVPLSGAASARDSRPDWLRPPEMSQMVMQLVDFWISRMENTSGLSAIVKGGMPTQRSAEGVMSAMQEAAFVRIRSALKNLEKTLERCGHKLADLIIDNYTEPRIVSIIGPDGEQSALALHARHFYSPSDGWATPLKFALTMRAGASTPTSRNARIAEADKLAALGAIDDQALLEAHQYPRIKELLERKYQKMQQGIWAAPGARQRAGRSK